jgi:hypothetical protein
MAKKSVKVLEFRRSLLCHTVDILVQCLGGFLAPQPSRPHMPRGINYDRSDVDALKAFKAKAVRYIAQRNTSSLILEPYPELLPT